MSRWGALAVLVSCAAWAQERGFLRTHVPGQPICLHWAKRVYTYSFHSAGS